MALLIPKHVFNNKRIFTSNGTFDIPLNLTKILVGGIGAGGGGGGGSNGGGAGAGGHGGCWGYTVIPLTGYDPTGTITVVIGAKGTGGANSAGTATAGTDGGATYITIGGLNVIYFGGGTGGGGAISGTGGVIVASLFNGNQSLGGNGNSVGGTGGTDARAAAMSPGPPQAGPGATAAKSGPGANGYHFGNGGLALGGASTNVATGINAAIYGAGGSGAGGGDASGAGGDGSDGYLEIYY